MTPPTRAGQLTRGTNLVVDAITGAPVVHGESPGQSHALDLAVAAGHAIGIPMVPGQGASDTYTRVAPRKRGATRGLLADDVPQEAHAPLFDRALRLSGRYPRWSRLVRHKA